MIGVVNGECNEMTTVKRVSKTREQLIRILPKASIDWIYDKYNLTTRKSWYQNTPFLRESILAYWETHSDVGIDIFRELERLAAK